MARFTMAFEGFTVESRDSLEYGSFCMFLTKYTVEQDIQLTVTPFFVFPEKVAHGALSAKICLEMQVEIVHIQPEIFHHRADGEAFSQRFAFQQISQHGNIQRVKGLAALCDLLPQRCRGMERGIGKKGQVQRVPGKKTKPGVKVAL